MKDSNATDLKADIDVYNRLIKRSKADDKTYYSKAEALVKLATATETVEEKKNYQQQALQAYSKAIELAKEGNPLYLIDRSKLYVEMGQTDLAVSDIKQVEKLPKIDDIAGMYVKNMVRDISRLDAVQTSIRTLVKDGTIDAELARALQEHAKVTAGLVVQVGEHGEQLEKHDGRLQLLESVVNQLLEGQKVSQQQIVELGLKQNTLEVKSEQQQQRLNEHHEVLNDGGVYDKAAIKQGFGLLEATPELNSYCKTFYWTTLNLFAACKVLSSGMIKGDIDYNQSMKDKAVEVVIEKAISYGAELTKSIPFVGGVIGLLDSVKDDICDKVKENKLENKVNAINKIIQAKFSTDEEISIYIAKAALAITEARTKDILSPPKVNKPSKLQAKINWLQNKVEAIKEKVLPSVELYDKDSYGTKLALQDVTLLMEYLWKNHQALIVEKQPLDQQLAYIVQHGGLESTLESLVVDSTEVYMFNKTVYDNELLNHPELLKYVQKDFSISTILDLSARLDSNLILEAVNNNDYDMVLAGLVSLENNC